MTSRAARRRIPRGRPRWLIAGLVAVLALVAGCTGDPAPDPGGGPAQQLAAFVADWQKLEPDDAAQLTTDPAAAAQMIREVDNNLDPDKLTISTGDISRSGTDEASTTATLTWDLPDAGPWSYPTTWTWRRTSNAGDWLLDWSPTVIHPKLGARQTLATRTSEAQAGVLVDRNNQQIVSPVRVYSVVLLPAKADVPAAAAGLAKVLASLDPTITAKSIVAGAAAAVADAKKPVTSAPPTAAPPTATQPTARQPTTATKPAAPVDPASVGYTVINLREADYRKLKPQLDAIKGLTFPSEVRDLPPTRTFARAVLAGVTPIAAEKMKGTNGWKVNIIDTTGGALETLADHPAVAGARVTLTLDSRMQTDAEAALAGIKKPAVLLAMQPSTGELLAVAQNAAADAQGVPALTGQYPPGSTFKIVTATAGLDRGLIAPGKPVDCPGTYTVEGREIHNFDSFELGTVDATLAFAKSCNTTFAKLSTQLPADALPKAAADYGIGLDFVMAGAITLTGKVPAAQTTVQRAENGFGQGQILITPFSAVLMAATAANGAMPMPVLIRGTKTTVDKPAPARPATVQQGVQTFMKAVVDEGTAKVLQPFGAVHAKTGTAEFTGDDGATHAHAWTVGYVGDLAFAALIVGGEESSLTNEVLAQFLTAVRP